MLSASLKWSERASEHPVHQSSHHAPRLRPRSRPRPKRFTAVSSRISSYQPEHLSIRLGRMRLPNCRFRVAQFYNTAGSTPLMAVASASTSMSISMSSMRPGSPFLDHDRDHRRHFYQEMYHHDEHGSSSSSTMRTNEHDGADAGNRAGAEAGAGYTDENVYLSQQGMSRATKELGLLGKKNR